MSHRGRHSADEVLAAALAAGRTVRDAAAEAKVSEKTAYRRNKDPEFRRRVAELRSQMVGEAAGVLADSMKYAAAALRLMVTSTDLNLRHRAARSILEFGIKVAELADLERRVRELEERAAAT